MHRAFLSLAATPLLALAASAAAAGAAESASREVAASERKARCMGDPRLKGCGAILKQ